MISIYIYVLVHFVLAQTKAGLSGGLGIGGGIVTGFGAGGIFLFASFGPQALITILVVVA